MSVSERRTDRECVVADGCIRNYGIVFYSESCGGCRFRVDRHGYYCGVKILTDRI